MVTVNDVKEFLQTAGADFSEDRIADAISLAEQRIQRLLKVESIPQTEEVKKALILLAVAELSPEINLYYRGKENVVVLRTKDVITEAERLLGLIPEKEPLKWVSIKSDS